MSDFMPQKVVESAALSDNGSGTWLVQLISEGVGSSGVYPGDVLSRDGATAFPSGTQFFMDHLTYSEEFERNGNHSIKDLVGVTLEAATYDEESKSLRAPVKWFNGYDTFIGEAKDYIGLSIEAEAIISDGVIESILPSPFNAVAVVPRAGRDGKVLSLMESYRQKHGIINTELDARKEEAVKPEDIEAIVEAFTKVLDTKFTALTEALKPAAPSEEHEEDAIDVAAVAEAVAEADLPKSARSRVYKAVESGIKVAEAVEAEKTYMKEITESLKETAVGTIKGAAPSNDDFTGGW